MPSYEMVYRHKPNSQWVSKGREFSVPIKINSKGLRDYEYDLEKKDNVFRIALVGDSITEARQVELDETFAKLVEVELNRLNKQKGKYRKIEVINFGVSDYGTDDEFIRIKADVLDYDPDLVIIVFVNNDLNNVLCNKFFRIDDEGRLVMRQFSRTWQRKLLVRIFGKLHLFYYSRLVLSNYPTVYNYIAEKIDRWIGLPEGYDEQKRLRREMQKRFESEYPTRINYYVNKYQTELEEAYAIVEKLYDEMHKLLSKRGIDLLAVHATHLVRINPTVIHRYNIERYGLKMEDIDVTLPYRRMSEIWSRLRIKHLNMADYLKELADKGNSLHFKRDGHLNPTGHRYFANHIIAYLINNKMVFGD